MARATAGRHLHRAGQLEVLFSTRNVHSDLDRPDAAPRPVRAALDRRGLLTTERRRQTRPPSAPQNGLRLRSLRSNGGYLAILLVTVVAAFSVLLLAGQL